MEVRSRVFFTICSLIVVFARKQNKNKKRSSPINTCHADYFSLNSCADPEGGPGVRIPPGKSNAIGFLSNAGPDHLENHKAAESAFNV